MTSTAPDSEANKRAWDTLYRETNGSVWGKDPIPFVEEILASLHGEIGAGDPVLDAASGDGRHLPLLRQTRGMVHSCDASEAALEKQCQPDTADDVRRSRCDLSATPYEDGHFQFISLIDTIETLPEPEPALREMHRILRPGGKLLCNIPDEEDEIAADAMDPLSADEEVPAYLYQGAYYYRFYPEGEALDLVRACGFEIVRNEIHHWREEPHPGFREYAHDHTSRVLLLIRK